VPRGSIDLSIMYAIQWLAEYGHTTVEWSVELPVDIFLRSDAVGLYPLETARVFAVPVNPQNLTG